VISRIHESPSDPDDEKDNANLDDDDDAIDEGRLLGPANKQTREQQQDEHRGDVRHPVHTGVVGHFEWRMRPLIWNAQAEPVEHAIEVFAPGDGDRRRAHGIFQNQIPTDDPGNELAHGGVGIGVGAPCDGDHRGELGVTKTGKGTADASDNEGEHDRRTRAISNRGRGADEQTRTNDRADAERDQVHRPEGAFQAVLADLLCFGHQLVERFSRE